MSEQKIVTELKVSGHLMKLDPGLYCVFQSPNTRNPNPTTGLPGVRISLPPGPAGANGGVEISGFREDGWVSTGNDAALIRVTEGPAQVLVTVYQSTLGGDAVPQLQVVRLGEFRPNGSQGAEAAGAPAASPVTQPVPAAEGAPAAAAAPEKERGGLAVTAHVQRRGDVGAGLGEWIGERGSKLWVEGFSITPPPGLRPEDLEYQAVLGRGWLSPWSQGGQFCGSRRMALPILGLRVRLRGAAANGFECSYSASFTDGSAIGPVAGGEPCEAESLAPLEALQVILRPRGAGARPVAGAPAQSARPIPPPAATPATPVRQGPPPAAGVARPGPVPAARKPEDKGHDRPRHVAHDKHAGRRGLPPPGAAKRAGKPAQRGR